MALRDGRCPNCGSLLHLESNQENGHCLFCDAVFPAKQSFDIAANPGDYEYPNLPQPKYEGPALNPKAPAPYSLPAAQTAVRKKVASKNEPEPYVKKDIKVPDIRMTMKTKLIFAAVIVGIFALFAAVTVPTAIKRDADRTTILAALQTTSPIPLDPESEVALRKTGNSFLMVVTGETVTEEQAIDLFKAFSLERGKVHGVDTADERSLYKGITLRLAHAGGGFLIENASSAMLDSGEAVKSIS